MINIIPLVNEENHTTQDNFNLASIITDMIDAKIIKLKTDVSEMYNRITCELKQLQSLQVEADRVRFLQNVRNSLELYINPGADVKADNPIYYILLYILESTGEVSYTRLDEKDNITITAGESIAVDIVIYLLNTYKPYLALRSGYSAIEQMLAAILNPCKKGEG